MRNNPSDFGDENLPTENLSGCDCIKYCNLKSVIEGLKLNYNVGKHKKDPDSESSIDNLKWTVDVKAGTDAYSLPTEVEWKYSANRGIEKAI